MLSDTFSLKGMVPESSYRRNLSVKMFGMRYYATNDCSTTLRAVNSPLGELSYTDQPMIPND